MLIQSVRAIPVKLPLPHAMEWATGRMTAQSHVLVRVMTDEGVEGIAEAIPRENIYGETQAGMVHVINDHLAPLIVGLDPFDVEKIHEKMGFIKGNLAAKGGIDVALWDIIGKACGMKAFRYPCEFMDFEQEGRPSLINESIRFEGGRVFAPDGPGLGVTLDEDAVARYTVEL